MRSRRRSGSCLGRDAPSQESKFLWALKDVSFEVTAGDAVGIIGRNGAGKTTLLKVLSRITEPTEGRAMLDGRVGSLLEVGTGFHPELTGRENVYLNGAILGMSRADITKRFDEIVAFAEVDAFSRHACEALLERHASAPGFRCGGPFGARDPDRRRSPRRRGRPFQRKCLGRMGGGGQRRPHRPVRQSQHGNRWAACVRKAYGSMLGLHQ